MEIFKIAISKILDFQRRLEIRYKGFIIKLPQDIRYDRESQNWLSAFFCYPILNLADTLVLENPKSLNLSYFTCFILIISLVSNKKTVTWSLFVVCSGFFCS